MSLPVLIPYSPLNDACLSHQKLSSIFKNSVPLSRNNAALIKHISKPRSIPISSKSSSDFSLNSKIETVATRRNAILNFFQISSAIATSLTLLDVHDSLSATAETLKETNRFFQTPSGIKFQDVIEGKGAMVKFDDRVEINYVCRRSNGYFVYSTVDPLNGNTEPIFLKLGEDKVIKGLEDLLIGMQEGGKRRAIIPPSLGYVNRSLEPQPKEFGPLRALFAHATEPLFFEVQVLKIK